MEKGKGKGKGNKKGKKARKVSPEPEDEDDVTIAALTIEDNDALDLEDLEYFQDSRRSFAFLQQVTAE